MKTKTPKWKRTAARKIARQLKDSGWFGWQSQQINGEWVITSGYRMSNHLCLSLLI